MNLNFLSKCDQTPIYGLHIVASYKFCWLVMHVNLWYTISHVHTLRSLSELEFEVIFSSKGSQKPVYSLYILQVMTFVLLLTKHKYAIFIWEQEIVFFNLISIEPFLFKFLFKLFVISTYQCLHTSHKKYKLINAISKNFKRQWNTRIEVIYRLLP